MAQVKLQFKDAKKSKLVITRSIQLNVQKNGSRKTKTLDSNLMMMRGTERTNLSKRVAEMYVQSPSLPTNEITTSHRYTKKVIPLTGEHRDELIPKYLGVSSAVLENVIFCHQDESLWPMSEPLVLKKQFDKIFEAQKYSNALDNLKKLRKSQADDLKNLRTEEEHLKVDKSRADRNKSRSTQLHDEIAALSDRMSDLEKQIKDAADDLTQKQASASNAYQHVNTLEAVSTQAQFTKDNIDVLKANMKVYTESDEWLQQTLAQYEERMAEFEREIEKFRDQHVAIKASIEKAEKQLSQKQSEKGQLIAEKENYERQVESRLELVRTSARQHSMRGFDGDIDNVQVKEFVAKIQKISREKDRELEKIRKQMDEELQAKQNVLTNLESKRASRTGEKAIARQNINTNEKKVTSNQQKINSIDMDEGTNAALESSYRDIQQRLDSLRSDYEAADWDNNIRKAETERRDLGAESARLRTELISSNKVAEAQAQFQLVKKELKDRQARLETMKSTYHEQLSAVIGRNWTVDSLEENFEEATDKRASVVSDAKKKQEQLSRDLNTLEYKLKSSRDNLKRKKDEMRKLSDVVMKSITREDDSPIESIDEYPKELAELEYERNKAKADVDSSTHLTKFFELAKGSIEKRNCCSLCDRSFGANGAEKSKALQKIEGRLNQVKEDELAESLADMEEQLKKANAARQQYDAYKTLSENDVPSLEKDVKKNESEKKLLVDSLEEQDLVVADAVASQRDVDSLVKSVGTITQYKNDIAKYEADITRLSSQQKMSGSSLNTEELDQQSTTCEESIRTLDSKLNKLRSDEKKAGSSINLLEKEEGEVSQKISSAKHLLEKKQALSDEMKDLRDSSSKLRESMQAADAELESLAPEVAKAKASYEDVQSRGRAKEKQVQADKNEVANSIHKFKLVDDSINHYLDNDGLGKLASCERAIARVEQQKRDYLAEQQEINSKGNAIKQQTADSESNRKNISENIRYRSELKKLKQYQKEIAELQSRNVKDDYEQLQMEADEAAKDHQDLVARRGPISGEISAKDDELLRLIEEYENYYNNTNDQFREAHVKAELTKAAVDDMAKYSDALETAIMKYHSLKMEEINQIAGELWQRTYQGTDVDTIMIKSENENLAQKRSYNYRVVMVKGDAEMDMRGRCSAGQKVLASIIIRLALAECFGVNCGVSLFSFISIFSISCLLLIHFTGHCSRRANYQSRYR